MNRKNSSISLNIVLITTFVLTVGTVVGRTSYGAVLKTAAITQTQSPAGMPAAKLDPSRGVVPVYADPQIFSFNDSQKSITSTSQAPKVKSNEALSLRF